MAKGGKRIRKRSKYKSLKGGRWGKTKEGSRTYQNLGLKGERRSEIKQDSGVRGEGQKGEEGKGKEKKEREANGRRREKGESSTSYL